MALKQDESIRCARELNLARDDETDCRVDGGGKGYAIIERARVRGGGMADIEFHGRLRPRPVCSRRDGDKSPAATSQSAASCNNGQRRDPPGS